MYDSTTILFPYFMLSTLQSMNEWTSLIFIMKRSLPANKRPYPFVGADLSCPSPIMIFNVQDRQEDLSLRASLSSFAPPCHWAWAKNLGSRHVRSFASLRMTTFYRSWLWKIIIGPQEPPHNAYPFDYLCIIFVILSNAKDLAQTSRCFVTLSKTAHLNCYPMYRKVSSWATRRISLNGPRCFAMLNMTRPDIIRHTLHYAWQ